jgi:hypothetical protein
VIDTSEPRIVLTGVKETLDVLRQFDEDAVKQFNRLVNSELTLVQRKSKELVDRVQSQYSYTPMRGWKTTRATNGTAWSGQGWPEWDRDTIKQGIKRTRAQRRVRKDYTTNYGAVLNTSDAGKVFELSGKVTKSGQFVENLNWFGKASRLVWRIVDQERPRIEKEVSKELDKLKQQLQTHLDNAGRAN